MLKNKIALIVTGALTLATAQAQAAPAYPSRPVRIVVPFPPGGTPDVLGRIVAQKLTTSLGQGFIIDNRSGAAGNIGVEVVAHSAPDGYTLLVGNAGPLAINPSLYLKLPFDPIKDFAPISFIGIVPNVLVVQKDVPAHSVKELVALAKKEPGKLDYGSAGVGSVPYMAVEYFKQLTGTQIEAIQYRGTGAMLPDLISGKISISMAGVTAFLPYIKSGQLRALAVGAKKRIDLLPDVPTVAEAGIPKYDQTIWYGILAPAGTPKDITAKLHSELVKVLKDPGVIRQYAEQGAIPISNTPREMGDQIVSETAKWAGVIKASGAKPQ